MYSKDEYNKLLEEVRELKAKISDYEKIKYRKEERTSALKRVSVRLLSGPRLYRAIHAWMSEVIRLKRIPANESLDLVSSLITRFSRIGLIGLLLSTLPLIILLFQTLLLSRQNSIISSQNYFYQEQTTALREQVELQRRAIFRQVYDEELDKVKSRLIMNLASELKVNLEQLEQDVFQVGPLRIEVNESGLIVNAQMKTLFEKNSATILETGRVIMGALSQKVLTMEKLVDEIEIRAPSATFEEEIISRRFQKFSQRLSGERSIALYQLFKKNGIPGFKIIPTSVNQYDLDSASGFVKKGHIPPLEIRFSLDGKDYMDRALESLRDSLSN